MSRHDRDPKRKLPPQQPLVETSALTIDQELALAAYDRSLPQIDFHGLTRGDVPFEIDRLVRQNSGRCVRIIYGRGRGIMASEVMGYLHRMQIRRNTPLLGLREDANLASVVVRIK